MPSTPAPLDRTHSNRSLGSDSNKSIGIAAVHAVPQVSNLDSQASISVAPMAIPGPAKASRGFNKWMVSLVKGSNASKKKEARISELLKAAASAGGAIGGGQYCTAEGHGLNSKTALKSSPWNNSSLQH